MKIILIFLVLFISSSCGTLKAWKEDIANNPQNTSLTIYKDQDFIDHLAFLGKEYLNTPGIETIRISRKSTRYLESIYDRVTENSELILKYNSRPSFHIIKSQIPFYFSLPRAQFFFSKGLVEKFLKNENLLVAALTFEIVKSQRKIYLKKAVVPIGFLETKRMVALTSIPLDIKMEVNKWTFYALKRAGYDSSAYLNWLQTQNKNTLDFMFQLGSGKQISKEEFLFKNFIVKQGVKDRSDEIRGPSNSSREFYGLLNEIGSGRT